MSPLLAKWEERLWVPLQVGAYLLIVILFYIGQSHDRVQRETLAKDTRNTAIALCEQSNKQNATIRVFVRAFVATDGELTPRDQETLEIADQTFAAIDCSSVSPRP